MKSGAWKKVQMLTIKGRNSVGVRITFLCAMPLDSMLELCVLTPSALDHSTTSIHQRPVLERFDSEERVTKKVEDIERDTTTLARPQVKRGFSDQTLVGSDIGDLKLRPLEDVNCTMTPAISGTATPTTQEPQTPMAPPADPLEESINLRRLRIFACCSALCLNGWKFVTTPPDLIC